MTAFWKCVSCQGMGRVYVGDEMRWWVCPGCGGRGISLSAVVLALLLTIGAGFTAYGFLGQPSQVAVMHPATAMPAAPASPDLTPAAHQTLRAD